MGGVGIATAITDARPIPVGVAGWCGVGGGRGGCRRCVGGCVCVFGGCGPPAFAPVRARRLRPAPTRGRWRSVRVAGCSRPPTSAANTVSVFSVGPGGALTPVTGLPVCDRQRPGLGGVQPGWRAARDRQRRRQHGVGVLGRFRRRADPGPARRLRPAAARRRWRSVRVAGCSRPPTRRQHGVGVLGRARRRADPGPARRLRPAAARVGGVQPGWAGCSRPPTSGEHGVGVLGRCSGGALTPVAGSPFATGSIPDSVAFSPAGGLLATANTATTRCRCSRSVPAAR